MKSILRPWTIGLLVSLIGLVSTITVVTQYSRSSSVPIWDSDGFWLWVCSPFVAWATASIITQERFYPSLFICLGSTLSVVGGLLFLWQDAVTPRLSGGGMNPFSSGSSALTMIVVAVFQWILLLFTLCLAWAIDLWTRTATQRNN